MSSSVNCRKIRICGKFFLLQYVNASQTVFAMRMATLIHAEIVRKNKSILLYITNNGKLPEGVVVPKGGLLNLLRYVADCGGKMKIESLPQYVLSIELPSKNGEIEKE